MMKGLVLVSLFCATLAQYTGTVCSGTNTFSSANIQNGLALTLGVAASQVSLGAVTGNCASFAVSGTVTTAAWNTLCWSGLQQAQIASGVTSVSCSGTSQPSMMNTMMPYWYNQQSSGCGCGCGSSSSSNNWLPLLMSMMGGSPTGYSAGYTAGSTTANVCMGTSNFNAGNLQAAIASYFGISTSSVSIGSATSTGVTTCVPVSYPSTWVPDTTRWAAYCSSVVPSTLSSIGVTSISCSNNSPSSQNWASLMASMPSMSNCGCGSNNMYNMYSQYMSQYPWMTNTYPWATGQVSTSATVCTATTNFNAANVQAAIASFFGISSSSVTVSAATVSGTQTCATVTFPTSWVPDQTRWAAYCSSAVSSTLSAVGITSVTCQGNAYPAAYTTTWNAGTSTVCTPTQSFSLTNIQAAIANYFGISSTQVTVTAGVVSGSVTCTTVTFPSGWVADTTKWSLYCSSTVQTALANVGITSVTCVQPTVSSIPSTNMYGSSSMMQMFMQMCPMQYMMWQMMGNGNMMWNMPTQTTGTGMNQICTAINNFNAANIQAAVANHFGIATSSVSIGAVTTSGNMACASVTFPSGWVADTTKWSLFCSSTVATTLANVGVTQVGCSGSNWYTGSSSSWAYPSTVCTPLNSFSASNIQATIANFFGISASSVSIGSVSTANTLSCAQVSFVSNWVPDTTKWSWYCANNAQTGLPGVGVTSVSCNAVNNNYNYNTGMAYTNSNSMYQMMMMMMMMQPSSSCGCSSCSSNNNNNMCNMLMMQAMTGKY